MSETIESATVAEKVAIQSSPEAATEGASAPGNVPPPPPPPALSQVEVAEQINQLLSERAAYRQQARKKFGNIKSALSKLGTHVGPPKPTARLDAVDFDAIDKALQLAGNAATHIEQIDEQLANEDAALKRAEQSRRNLILWACIGGAVIVLVLVLNAF